MALQSKTLAYLHEHRVMTLATTGPEGIWAAAVFYVNEGFDFYFLSSPGSRHSLNIAANPAVAATIHEDYEDWRDIQGVQLEGTARRIQGRERAKAISLYGRKFPVVSDILTAPKEIATALSRVAWYHMKPVRLFFIDNSLGLGHRDEVPLSR